VAVSDSGGPDTSQSSDPRNEEQLGLDMRACGSEAILLLVQLVHSGVNALPPWAREPAHRIVSRYHRATSRLNHRFDAAAKDNRR